MPKRCVIYLRVSTAEQAAPGHHSLDAQEMLCRRYADGHAIEVAEVIRDEGFSGRTTQRPGFRRLLAFISDQPPVAIQAILVQDTSRMGRDTVEYLMFRKELRKRGIDLVAVTQPNIDSSPEGTLVDTIIAGINQYHSEEKGRRVTIAMMKKFDDGWWPSTAPIGYVNVDVDGKRRVIPDPERFTYISLAFTEYATGRYSQDQLRDLLTERGLRDRRGKPISRTTLNQALANPFYWGLMRWNGQEQAGRHEPATDRTTWERCQRITQAHAGYVARSRRHVFLLAGLVVCAACGRPLTHSVIAKKRKRYYHCNSRNKCEQPYVAEERLEDEVTRLIEGVRLSEAFIARVVERVESVFGKRIKEFEAERAAVSRRKTLLEQQRDLAEEKLLSGVLTDEAFRRHVPKIASELDDVACRLEELEQARRIDTTILRDLLQFARDIPAAYAQAPAELKKQYLQFFFNRFVVQDRHIVQAVPTDLFEALFEHGQVRSKAVWCPQQDAIRTIIDLLRNPAWLSQQMAFLKKVQPVLKVA